MQVETLGWIAGFEVSGWLVGEWVETRFYVKENSMARERWGTFAVADHIRRGAFIEEVLLFDRLIIPYPPDAAERELWRKEGWQPGRLDQCLDIIGDLAIIVPWDKVAQGYYSSRLGVAGYLSSECDALIQASEKGRSYRFSLTRGVLARDLLPERPPGVSKIWPMAAFPSLETLEHESKSGDVQATRERLTYVIGHRFLVPHDSRLSDLNLLKEVVKLARTAEYRAKRAAFYQWQEDIIANGIADDEAIRELDGHLVAYNEIVKEHSRETRLRYGYTISGVAISLAAAPQSMLTYIGVILSFAQLATIDRKKLHSAGIAEPAVMFHAAQKLLGWS